MQTSIPKDMTAAAIDRFGGPEVLHTETLPVPRPGGHARRRSRCRRCVGSTRKR